MNATTKQFLQAFNPVNWMKGVFGEKNFEITYTNVDLAEDDYQNPGFFTQAEKQQLQAILAEAINSEEANRLYNLAIVASVNSQKEAAIEAGMLEGWKEYKSSVFKYIAKNDKRIAKLAKLQAKVKHSLRVVG